MRAHIIENGIVVNTIEVDSLEFMPNLISADLGGEVGDSYDNGSFKKPIIPEIKQVPSHVSMRQARLALLRVGKLSEVSSVISSMQGSLGDAARIEWEFSNEVKRDQPLINQLKPLLNMSDADLDDLFILAATL